ncbi:PREDICTED: uncharacterized protein LOC109584431 isoform X3 [Amphimedon queenslandica]|uniref:Uncharacterized protein n=1 Tax=Amphimedon queenslandica TaxID=400682 RepID=A0AAN0JFD3_AMPQE|nr:PREDICTED: uncharacterized protein LOC109584431 isoform X3 [Amphimedon queenslandica]|eukprot:XP_019855750.1 PREDICTED: uncharacterized protein LOC109584431 isoform X3 [Amphimedon queenslandica]
MMFVAIFLLFLSPVLSAAADIYVSSSDGINNTSCWTGGVQTPCATLDLAIQGAFARSTAVPRGGGGGGNESGIVIYLLPGTYTATVLEQQLMSNNVSIISMRNESEQVRITVPKSSTNHLVKYFDTFAAVEYNCPQLNVELVKSSLRCSQERGCECLKFTATVIDCRGKKFDWRNDLKLKVCIDSIFYCTDEDISTTFDCGSYQYCDSDNEYPNYCYKLTSFCYDNIETPEITLYFSTVGLITLSTNITVDATRKWFYPTTCSSNQKYCPYCNTFL